MLDPGQNAQMKFAATEGRRYRISLPANSMWWQDVRVRIFAPDGTKIADTTAASGAVWYVESAQAGVYRIEADPIDEASGTMTFRFKDATDLDLLPLVDGSTLTTILDPGQNAQMRFTAISGHRYRISLPANSIYWQDLRVRICAPDGTTVADTTGAAGSLWTIESAQAGVYRVVADPVGEASGSVTFRFKDATDLDLTPGRWQRHHPGA